MQDETYDKRLAAFISLLKCAKKAVFFGGAGVSTESGLKDYRSKDGMYNTVREFGVPPETILSHDFLLGHPDVFYRFYNTYFLQGNPKPNGAHTALAELEAKGILSAVITQNVDGLHTAAHSKTVYELHGTSARHYCVKCGAAYQKEKLIQLCGAVPKCEKCGGFVRPDIVMYGEMLCDETVDGAVKAIKEADLLIVGGTSLAVYPAAGFIGYYHGKDIVLINQGETPLDTEATLVFRESIGKVLGEAVSALV